MLLLQGGMGSIPGRGNEMPSAFGDMAKKKKKKNNFTMDLPPIPFPISLSKKKALIEKCSVPNQSSGKLFCCCLVTKLLSDLL